MVSFKKQKWFWILASLATPSIAFALTAFTTGTPISAQAMNANFAELDSRLDALEARATGLTAIPTPVIVQGNDGDVGPSGSDISTATCGNNRVIVGGGCTYVSYAGAQGAQNTVVNGPFAASSDFSGRLAAINTSTNSWSCVVEDAQGIDGNTFRAYAVCMPIR